MNKKDMIFVSCGDVSRESNDGDAGVWSVDQHRARAKCDGFGRALVRRGGRGGLGLGLGLGGVARRGGRRYGGGAVERGKRSDDGGGRRARYASCSPSR